MTNISNTDNTIEASEVLKRIEELSALLAEKGHPNATPENYDPEESGEDYSEEVDELAALKSFADDARLNENWAANSTLISDIFFEEYAQQFIEDVDGIRPESFIYSFIDWEAVADAMKVDYFSADWSGQEYWIRA